jgi:inner membrane protein
MDTLTHALSGALLARALTGPPSRCARRDAPLGRPDGLAPPPPAAVAAGGRFGPPIPVWHAVALGFVAAAFPDSDVVLRLVSDLAYLRGHRGLTHSLVMLPLWSLLLGVLAAAVLRNRAGWRRYGWIAAAAIGIHIAGDWITQFGTMLLAPLSDARFGLGSTFIIDLALSAIIVAGLVASALLRASRVPALVALALLPAWIGVSLVGRHEATQFARAWAEEHGIAAQSIGASPRPASPFNWTVYVFDGESYHVAHVNTRRRQPLPVRDGDHLIRRLSAPYQPLAFATWERLPKFGADAQALAREVWQHPQFEFFRWFAMFPLVYRIDASERETCVWYRDLRFSFPGRGSMPFRFGMCRDGPGSDWSPFVLDDIAGRAALR